MKVPPETDVVGRLHIIIDRVETARMLAGEISAGTTEKPLKIEPPEDSLAEAYQAACELWELFGFYYPTNEDEPESEPGEASEGTTEAYLETLPSPERQKLVEHMRETEDRIAARHEQSPAEKLWVIDETNERGNEVYERNVTGEALPRSLAEARVRYLKGLHPNRHYQVRERV